MYFVTLTTLKTVNVFAFNDKITQKVAFILKKQLYC